MTYREFKKVLDEMSSEKLDDNVMDFDSFLGEVFIIDSFMDDQCVFVIDTVLAHG